MHLSKLFDIVRSVPPRNCLRIGSTWHTSDEPLWQSQRQNQLQLAFLGYNSESFIHFRICGALPQLLSAKLALKLSI
jgi:hypothetical protein